MDEGDPAASRSDPWCFIDQSVSPGHAFSQRLVEIGDTVADVMNAGAAPLEESRDRPLGREWLEQFDFGFAELNGNDARAVGRFRRMGQGAQHITVERQRGFNALDRDADVGNDRA